MEDGLDILNEWMNDLVNTTGNDIIEEERRRLYELRQRAAAEGKTEWVERKARETHCKSIHSLESEESSVTSSDSPSEKETRWDLHVYR